MKALAYTRISKDETNSLSLAYQKAEIEEYCRREGLTLIGVESDEGISGKSIKARRGVQRVLQAVDNREVDAVCVYKSDRMSRNGIESLQIEKLLLRRGVAYLSVTEGNLCSDSVDDEFMRFVRAGLNQRERRLIALRTREALRLKKARGEKLGGYCPYGFRSVNGKLIGHPGEQRTIARIRELQGQGYSSREIAAALTREGRFTRKGTPWTHTGILRVLRRAA